MIVNLQRKIRLSVDTYRAFVERILLEIPEARDSEFAVAFVSDRKMKELNSLFRGQSSTTDVLSFPYLQGEFETEELLSAGSNGRKSPAKRYLGDIVISAEQASRQAEAAGHTFKLEVEQLILHGVLHLCGYDHETDNGEMNARELKLRHILGIE